MKQLESFEELLPLLKSGSSIVMHSAAAEPRWLEEQLALCGSELKDIDI